MTSIETAVASILLKQGKKFVKGDEPDKGELRGHYDLIPISKGEWWYEPDKVDPMRFWHEKSGYEFAVLEPFKTDGGTIPSIVSKLAPREYLFLKKTDFIEQFIIHDFLCKAGFVWVRRKGGIWAKMPITPVQADVLLHIMLGSPSLPAPYLGKGKEANRATAFAIYQAVKAFHALSSGQ